MEILFITHKFPPSIGGMQKQSYELINGMRKYSKVHTIIQSPVESKFSFFLKLPFRIKRMLRKNKGIMAIHCNDGVVAGLCTWLKNYTSIPITTTLHGLDVVFPNRIFQNWIIPKIQKFDKIFVVSQGTADACLERGFSRDQLCIIENGVDTDLASIPKDTSFLKTFQKKHHIALSDKKILLSVGRAVKRKGFSWFVNNVCPALPKDTLYLIAGPRSNSNSFFHLLLTSLPNAIRKQIELFLGYPSDDTSLTTALKKNAADNAFHLGSLPWSELVQLMSHADLLVMPNFKVDGDMEGFGLVALEANLRGTYVLASGLEGIESAITSGKNGELCQSQNQSEWINQVNALLHDSKELKLQGAKAKDYVLDHYSWETMAVAYFKEFQSLKEARKDIVFIPETLSDIIAIDLKAG